MRRIIENQRDYFNSGTTKSLAFRKKQLKQFEFAIRSNEQRLNDAIFADFKKSAFDNYTNELSLVYAEIKHALKGLKEWSRKQRVDTDLINFPAKSYIIPEPLGVILVISTWNYPYQLSFGPAVSAIAAGNTVVIKPSELSINTSRVIAEIIAENFSPEYVTVVEGAVPETTELLKQKFDKIFFTGSVAVGKIIYKAAAENLTPVTLELGGKSPAFVTKDCNLKMTVKRLVWSRFLNAGQTCIAPDFVMVDKAIEQPFINALKAEIKASHFSVENDNYVQIINKKNLNRLLNLIDTEKLIYGGEHDRENRILKPTLLHPISFDDPIMEDEVFGPILPIIPYDNLDEMIAKVKAIPKPLACYAFTSSAATKKKIINEISFGGGGINEAVMHITNSNLPFGGVGQSGIGSYHGEHGFKTFSHYKSIVEKPTWFELNLKYYPHSEKKFKLVKRLLKL